MSAVQENGRARHGWLRWVLACLALGVAGWGGGALWFQAPGLAGRGVLVLWCLLGILTVALLIGWDRLRAAHPWAERARWLPGIFALAFAALQIWWQSLAPSHDRPWADDVARLLQPEIAGDQVTLHQVRNFDWRTETDYTPRWETRHLALSKLESADLILSYWMGPHIAHTLVSFGFEDGQRLAFSLEIRKERHESFSAVAGFFRQYEQVIIAADEHDIIRTRSNARGEDVYLYRLNLDRAQLRTVFLAYLKEAEALRQRPAFYDTLGSNCTTIVFDLARQLDPGLPLDWRLLASGHFAAYAFDHQGLAPGRTYAELQRLGHINPRALPADQATAGLGPREASERFSAAIRAGVPGWELDSRD
ncbi:MAG: DUF4105 domain-containing protein [Lautropia sp.]|nr:DUF4105 domain-containing protein [Lautropia sp.]